MCFTNFSNCLFGRAESILRLTEHTVVYSSGGKTAARQAFTDIGLYENATIFLVFTSQSRVKNQDEGIFKFEARFKILVCSADKINF